jgi:hypothetical protein
MNTYTPSSVPNHMVLLYGSYKAHHLDPFSSSSEDFTSASASPNSSSSEEEEESSELLLESGTSLTGEFGGWIRQDFRRHPLQLPIL